VTTQNELAIRSKELAPHYLSEAIDYVVATFDEASLGDMTPEDLIELAQRELEERKAEEVQREQQREEFSGWEAVRIRIESAARMIVDEIEKQGWEIQDIYQSQSSHSRYITISHPDDPFGERREIRISDHAAPEYGGFNPETQERMGSASIELIVDRQGNYDTTSLSDFLKASNFAREQCNT